MKENKAAENVLGTLGAVLWTVQILPQVTALFLPLEYVADSLADCEIVSIKVDQRIEWLVDAVRLYHSLNALAVY